MTDVEIRTAVMGALDLILDHAYHDGNARDLAVAAEAYSLAGYHDGAIDIAHSGRHDDLLGRVVQARKGRPRRLLRADARGLLTGVTLLAENGLLTYSTTSEARRQRWLARGGHDYPNPDASAERTGEAERDG